MKLSDEQKKIAKAFAIFPICYIPTIIIYYTVKGDVVWADILLRSIAVIVMSVMIALFLIFASKTSEK